MDRRRVRTIAIALAAVLVLGALPVGLLYLGRRIAWFDIDRIVINGAHLVTPQEIVEVSGVQLGASLFDDSDPWEEAIRRHPVIADARVSRRFPSTLEIQLREKVAVGLLAADVLTLATSSGELLPVDPTAAPENLPIIAVDAPDSLAAGLAARILAETGRLTELDPQLVSAISEVRVEAGDPDVMRLHHASGEILLPLGSPAVRLAELRSVLADLSKVRTATAAVAVVASEEQQEKTAGPSRPPVIDLRFDGQVVVRHLLPREIS